MAVDRWLAGARLLGMRWPSNRLLTVLCVAVCTFGCGDSAASRAQIENYLIHRARVIQPLRNAVSGSVSNIETLKTEVANAEKFAEEEPVPAGLGSYHESTREEIRLAREHLDFLQLRWDDLNLKRDASYQVAWDNPDRESIEAAYRLAAAPVEEAIAKCERAWDEAAVERNRMLANIGISEKDYAEIVGP